MAQCCTVSNKSIARVSETKLESGYSLIKQRVVSIWSDKLRTQKKKKKKKKKKTQNKKISPKFKAKKKKILGVIL